MLVQPRRKALCRVTRLRTDVPADPATPLRTACAGGSCACVCVGTHAQDGSEPCGTIACPPAQEWMGTSVYSYGHVTIQQCRGTEANTHGYVSVCVCVCVCVSPSIHPVCMEQAGAYANSTAGHADPGLDPAVTPWAPGPGSVCCPDPGGGCRRRRVLSGAFLYVKG